MSAKTCLIFISTISVFLQGLSAQESVLNLFSCATKNPLGDVYVLNKQTGALVGYSDKNGNIEVETDLLLRTVELKLYKMSALDTVVVLTAGENKICAIEKSAVLSEVEITSAKVNLRDVFEAFLEKSISRLSLSDTILYFAFDYSVYAPEKNSSMEIEGKLKIPFSSYKHFYTGARMAAFTSLDVTIDSTFSTDSILINENSNFFYSYFGLFDALRKGHPYRKRIKKNMVLQRNEEGNQTSFVISKNVFDGKKLMVSYPTFGEDSILLQDRIVLTPIPEKVKERSRNAKILLEDVTCYYDLIEGELMMSGVEGLLVWKGLSGTIFESRIAAKWTDAVTKEKLDLNISEPLNIDTFRRLTSSSSFSLNYK